MDKEKGNKTPGGENKLNKGEINKNEVKKEQIRETFTDEDIAFENLEMSKQVEALHNAFLDAEKTDLELANHLKEKLYRVITKGEDPVRDVSFRPKKEDFDTMRKFMQGATLSLLKKELNQRLDEATNDPEDNWEIDQLKAYIQQKEELEKMNDISGQDTEQLKVNPHLKIDKSDTENLYDKTAVNFINEQNDYERYETSTTEQVSRPEFETSETEQLKEVQEGEYEPSDDDVLRLDKMAMSVSIDQLAKNIDIMDNSQDLNEKGRWQLGELKKKLETRQKSNDETIMTGSVENNEKTSEVKEKDVEYNLTVGEIGELSERVSKMDVNDLAEIIKAGELVKLSKKQEAELKVLKEKLRVKKEIIEMMNDWVKKNEELNIDKNIEEDKGVDEEEDDDDVNSSDTMQFALNKNKAKVLKSKKVSSPRPSLKTRIKPKVRKVERVNNISEKEESYEFNEKEAIDKVEKTLDGLEEQISGIRTVMESGRAYEWRSKDVGEAGKVYFLKGDLASLFNEIRRGGEDVKTALVKVLEPEWSLLNEKMKLLTNEAKNDSDRAAIEKLQKRIDVIFPNGDELTKRLVSLYEERNKIAAK